MREFGIFQALYMSFYSRRLYRDVALNWGGQSFVYLLALLAFAWVVFTYQIQQVISRGYSQVSAEIVTQIPVMTIKDGKLSTPENRPYVIKISNLKEPVMVIDTSGQYTTLDQVDSDVLLTSTKVLSRPNANQQRIYEIPSNINTVIEPEKVNENIKAFIGFSWIPIFIFALLGSYAYRIIQALVYGVIGKLVAMTLRIKLTYWQNVQIMMVAITPVIVVCTALRVLGTDVAHHNLFYFTLAMVYLVFGIYANKT